MSNYTTTTIVGQFLKRTLTSDEIAVLNSTIIPAVTRWIDRTLNSTFDTAAATTRYFDGGGHSIDIDPAQDITAVQGLNDDGTDSYSYTDLTEYVAEPVNQDVKTEIVHRGIVTPLGHKRFPQGLRRFAVTAKFTEYDFANSKIPEDIQLAATRIASGVLQAGKVTGQGGAVQSESLEGHSVTYDSTDDSINNIGSTDPIIQGILGARKELFVG